jgi:hypothetical protein
VLYHLLVLTLVAAPGPTAPAVVDAVRVVHPQEPSKPAPPPKKEPRPAPRSGGSASNSPSRGAPGAARPQAPRSSPGAAPRATGEPKLQRRGR